MITEDEVRSPAISQRLLGTSEIILIHHTDCGMVARSAACPAGRWTGTHPVGPPRSVARSPIVSGYDLRTPSDHGPALGPPTLADRVHDWFAAEARDLPWRRAGTTPWGVLVSEFMLQQTPVARVAPLWTAWMTTWPTPAALAAASRADVLRAWGRLGYPRRALRLHAAAVAIRDDHEGRVPSDVAALEALPGVGSYTARAVAAFGYGRRCPVVDTNVRRVVARAVLGAGDAGPARTTADLADVEALLPADDGRAAVVSAGLMELGAVVCVARTPRCGGCPVRDLCAWYAAGRPEYTGPRKPGQTYAGTDRQVRGRLLDVLRAAEAPVERAVLDAAWADAAQRDRCLFALLADGLTEQLPDGRFALPA